MPPPPYMPFTLTLTTPLSAHPLSGSLDQMTPLHTHVNSPWNSFQDYKLPRNLCLKQPTHLHSKPDPGAFPSPPFLPLPPTPQAFSRTEGAEGREESTFDMSVLIQWPVLPDLTSSSQPHLRRWVTQLGCGPQNLCSFLCLSAAPLDPLGGNRTGLSGRVLCPDSVQQACIHAWQGFKGQERSTEPRG